MKVKIFNYDSVASDLDFKGLDVDELASKIGELQFGSNRAELNIILVDREEIRRLNREYRDKDEVTDVLSFDPGVEQLLGELYICPDVVSERVKGHQCTPEMINQKLYRTELLRMIIHGTLHLVGLDHKSKYDGPYESTGGKDKDLEPIYQRQEELLKVLLNKLN